jgi:hypothetical protein
MMMMKIGVQSPDSVNVNFEISLIPSSINYYNTINYPLRELSVYPLSLSLLSVVVALCHTINAVAVRYLL